MVQHLTKATGKDGRFFPSKAPNSSRLLIDADHRSDADSTVHPSHLNVAKKLFQKCRVGLDDLRASVHSSGSAGHLLNGSHSSIESSLASFESSFHSIDYAEDIEGDNSDDDTEADKQDIEESDDHSLEEFFNDDLFRQQGLDPLDKSVSTTTDKSSALQLSFEGGLCLVQYLNGPIDGIGMNDLSASGRTNKEKRRQRSCTVPKNRRSRSHEVKLRNQPSHNKSNPKIPGNRGDGLGRSLSSENLGRSLHGSDACGRSSSTKTNRRDGVARSRSSFDSRPQNNCRTIATGGGRRDLLSASRSQSSRILPSVLSTSCHEARGTSRRPRLQRSLSSERLRIASEKTLPSSGLVARRMTSLNGGDLPGQASGYAAPRSGRPGLSRKQSVRSVSRERKDLLPSSSSHKLTELSW